jgi:hypothetical protein
MHHETSALVPDAIIIIIIIVTLFKNPNLSACSSPTVTAQHSI